MSATSSMPEIPPPPPSGMRPPPPPPGWETTTTWYSLQGLTTALTILLGASVVASVHWAVALVNRIGVANDVIDGSFDRRVKREPRRHAHKQSRPGGSGRLRHGNDTDTRQRYLVRELQKLGNTVILEPAA